jgi:WD40 repeat protein
MGTTDPPVSMSIYNTPRPGGFPLEGDAISYRERYFPLFCTLPAAFSLYGQTYTGSISGRVLDHSGLPIPKASVAVTEGKFLATASEDKTAKLWGSFSGHEILTLRGHQAGLTCVSYSPDGRRLATASRDKTVKVWDTASGRELITLGGLENPVACAAFSPDGKRIAAASVDKKVVLWDALAGRVLLTWRADRLNAYLATFAFSPDGTRIAAAGGNTISIWSDSTGQELTTLHQSRGRVTLIHFSPDGRRIAAANMDGTATLWDAVDGKETLSLRSGNVPLTSVAFSADGRRFATAERGGIVQVYALHIGDLLALARKRVTRPLTVSECRIYFQAEACPSLP